MNVYIGARKSDIVYVIKYYYPLYIFNFIFSYLKNEIKNITAFTICC